MLCLQQYWIILKWIGANEHVLGETAGRAPKNKIPKPPQQLVEHAESRLPVSRLSYSVYVLFVDVRLCEWWYCFLLLIWTYICYCFDLHHICTFGVGWGGMGWGGGCTNGGGTGLPQAILPILWMLIEARGRCRVPGPRGRDQLMRCIDMCFTLGGWRNVSHPITPLRATVDGALNFWGRAFHRVEQL